METDKQGTEVMMGVRENTRSGHVGHRSKHVGSGGEWFNRCRKDHDFGCGIFIYLFIAIQPVAAWLHHLLGGMAVLLMQCPCSQ